MIFRLLQKDCPMRISWTDLEVMSLDDVQLQNFYCDAIEEVRIDDDD